MRTEKWEMYMQTLQGHPSICRSAHTVEIMGFLRDIIPPKDFPKMLYIGAGEGLETKVLSELGYDVVGIVRGQSNIDFASSNYPNIKFVDTDMHDLPFACDTFDTVYMNQTFEHAFAPFVFLLEIYCVLRERGRVWIGLPEFKEIDDETANKDINHITHHHPNIICQNLYNQFFNKTGFIVLSSSKKNDPYFDNTFLLEKQPISFVHSDVRTSINRRKELFG